MAQQKIDALTSLRFFAAASIVVYHARGHFGLPPNFLEHFELSQGVSFFFVLSGFILAYVYPDLEAKGARSRFWLARFARVWPLHIATLILFVTLLPELSQAGPVPLLANLALIQAWIPNESWFFAFNSVSWSISAEAFFYLAFPFLIKNFEKNWPLKLAGSFLLMLVMVEFCNKMLLPAFSLDSVSVHALMYINPLSRVCEFVLGMTVCHLYRKYLADRQAPMILALAVEIASIAAVYLLARNTFKIANWLSPLPFVQEGGHMWLEHGGVPVVGYALLIATMAWGRGPIAKILRAKPLVFLGEISFATYLLHRIFLHYYWNHFAPLQGALPMATYAVFLLLSSYVLWSFVELPFRHLIVRGPVNMPKPALASGLSVACVAAICVGLWSGSPVDRLNLNETKSALLRDTTSGGGSGNVIGNIAFGDDLVLLASRTKQDDKGLTVTLYWQALRQKKLDNYIGMRLMSRENTLVRLKDFRQSEKEEVVNKDDCFKNVLFFPKSDLQYVDHLAFGLGDPKGHAPKPRIINPESEAADMDDATGPTQAGSEITVRTAKLPAIDKGLVDIDLGAPAVASKRNKPVL